MQIVAIIRKTGTVILSITVLCQVVAAVVFWWRARKVKPINWLPRFITLLAAIQGIMWSSYYISSYIFIKPFPPTVLFWMNIVTSITYPTIMGLLIRLERVQVQLRAQEENTIKILEAIRRANILQVVFVLALVVAQICLALGNYGIDVLNLSVKAAQALDITGRIFEIGVMCLLIYSLGGVNKQLALFFEQVGKKGYLKKSISLFLAAFLIFVIHYDVMMILTYFIEIGKIY